MPLTFAFDFEHRVTGIGATSRHVAKFEGSTLPQAEFSIRHTALKWTLANASKWPKAAVISSIQTKILAAKIPVAPLGVPTDRKSVV